MSELKKILRTVKGIPWGRASVSFYVVKRVLVQRSAKYEVMQVNIDASMSKKLRNIITEKIQSSNDVFEYEFTSCDLDDNVLGIDTAETDYDCIIKALMEGQDPPFASSPDHLLGAWMYVARLDRTDGTPLFAARRVSEGWTTKKVLKVMSAIYKNNMLVDLDQKQVFHIDRKIDFFAYDQVTFIADKRNFELALNFRVGMERNRDDIVAELTGMSLFANAPDISQLVGDNMRRLRKLSQVKNAGYYKSQEFLQNLKNVNDEEGWGLEYDAAGKLKVTDENIDTVLKLLNNDRLASKVNSEEFDVDVKHKIDAAPRVGDNGTSQATPGRVTHKLADQPM